MALLPQPPPDIPAPPPGPQPLQSRLMISRVIIGGVLVLIALLMVAMIFGTFRAPKMIYRTEASHNVRQLHLALINFEAGYGKFPHVSTIAAVQADTSTSLQLGISSSNEILRQLVATTAKVESIFWAKSAITPQKPDNDISGSQALKKGECAFAYIAGLSSSSHIGTPVLMAPVDPAKRCFERRRDYDKKAVILFVDGSVKILPIDRHGKVQINGIDIFDPRQPFWGGKAPDIKWPE